MSFESRLENLRAKPEHVRRRFAFWSSLGATALIFVFWLASFSILNMPAKGAVAEAVDRAGTPARSLVASVGDLFGDIKDLVFGSKKVEYNAVTVTPGDR